MMIPSYETLLTVAQLVGYSAVLVVLLKSMHKLAEIMHPVSDCYSAEELSEAYYGRVR